MRLGSRTVVGVLVLAACLTLSVPGSRAGSALGVVTGTVQFGTEAIRRPIAAAAYPTRGLRPRADALESELGNVVVFLKEPQLPAKLPVRNAAIRQRDEQFVPRVVAVTRGSSVEFPNADPFFHNVFSLSRTASFDLGRFPQGESRVRQFDQAGLVKVFCHLHSHMSAVILVFDHPYFAKVDSDGHFSIPEVPAGQHTLSAWHERIGESDLRIAVEGGRRTKADFLLPTPLP